MAKLENVHFSSKSDDWSTPQELFDKLHAIHKFTLDACAADDNKKCSYYFSKIDDGLRMNWLTKGTVWMKKAYQESLKGQKIVCLVPARTDTAWWHDYAMKGKIEFLRGRLKFGGHKNSAPFPSAIVVFEPKL